MLAAQLIDRAEHHFTVQLLDREPVVDEPLRQVLEQFRIRRPFAVDPEIARRVDNPRAEMAFPDAVDDDANGNRFLDDRLCELEAAAPFREGRGPVRAQHRQEVARRLVAKVERIASLAHLELDRLLGVLYAVHERIVGRLRGAQSFDIGPQILDVAPTLGAQLSFETPATKREEARLDTIARLRGIEAILKISLKHVGPQVGALDRQALQLEAASRTEIVVGDEVARELRRLL